jgi:hypothetical protein
MFEGKALSVCHEEERNARLTDWHLSDFTAPDCTAWVYDMFRPDKSYQARGLHPSVPLLDTWVHISAKTEVR